MCQLDRLQRLRDEIYQIVRKHKAEKNGDHLFLRIGNRLFHPAFHTFPLHDHCDPCICRYYTAAD